VGHFEREAYLQWLFPGAFLLVGFLAALLGTVCFRIADAVSAGRCLDAEGSYDYDQGRCDFEVQHPGP